MIQTAKLDLATLVSTFNLSKRLVFYQYRLRTATYIYIYIYTYEHENHAQLFRCCDATITGSSVKRRGRAVRT